MKEGNSLGTKARARSTDGACLLWRGCAAYTPESVALSHVPIGSMVIAKAKQGWQDCRYRELSEMDPFVKLGQSSQPAARFAGPKKVPGSWQEGSTGTS